MIEIYTWGILGMMAFVTLMLKWALATYPLEFESRPRWMIYLAVVMICVAWPFTLSQMVIRVCKKCIKIFKK